MTERERYKRAFSAVQPSTTFHLEETNMEQKAIRRPLRPLAVACAAVVLIMGLAAVAYAADIGGFRETVSLWMRGEQVSGTVEQYNEEWYLWTGENGEERWSQCAESFTEDDKGRVDFVSDEDGKAVAYYRDQTCVTDSRWPEKPGDYVIATFTGDNGEPFYWRFRYLGKDRNGNTHYEGQQVNADGETVDEAGNVVPDRTVEEALKAAESMEFALPPDKP